MHSPQLRFKGLGTGGAVRVSLTTNFLRHARRRCETSTVSYVSSNSFDLTTVANSPSKFVAVIIDSVAAGTLDPSRALRSKVCVASMAKYVS